MSHIHKAEVCQYGTTHAQCRCPGSAKNATVVPCPTPEQCAAPRYVPAGMTRETQVHRWDGTTWRRCEWAHYANTGACMVESDQPHRTIERYVTDWQEAPDGV